MYSATPPEAIPNSSAIAARSPLVAGLNVALFRLIAAPPQAPFYTGGATYLGDGGVPAPKVSAASNEGVAAERIATDLRKEGQIAGDWLPFSVKAL
jgi:hypothetical protein